MKVAELIKELRKLPKEAEVFLCKDWEEVDENGQLCDLYRLNDVCHQVNIVDEGLYFKEYNEVLLCFDEERAHAIINKNY